MSKMGDMQIEIIALLEDGFSADDIVKILNVPREWVHQCAEDLDIEWVESFVDEVWDD